MIPGCDSCDSNAVPGAPSASPGPSRAPGGSPSADATDCSVVGRGLRLRLLVLAALLASVGGTFLSPPPASAAPTQRLAVLELSGAFERDILLVFSDQVRQGALSALKGTPYEVMTRENMAMLARNQGIDLAACQEGAECEVDIGRNVGAALLISGGVTKVGASLFCTLKLHATDKGTLLASKTVKAPGEETMVEALVSETEALIREGLGLGRRGRSSAPVTAEEGSIGETSSFSVDSAAQDPVVRFESTPPGAVVLVDGDLLCPSTPCSKRLGLGSHRVAMQAEGYHPAKSDVRVESGMGPVALDLKASFALLSVTTRPAGLGLLLNGKPVGKAGLDGRKLEPGAYELLIDDRCYLRGGQRVVLKEGDERRLDLVGAARKSGLKVDVVDSEGNDLEGAVWVDGAKLGAAPGPFEVPFCSKKVEVRSGGMGSWSEELSLVENQVAARRAVPTAASDRAVPTAVSDKGCLLLTGSPGGLVVWLDGSKQGRRADRADAIKIRRSPGAVTVGMGMSDSPLVAVTTSLKSGGATVVPYIR